MGPIEKTKSEKNMRSKGGFIFGKIMGEGRFNTVYLANDMHTGKEYAIKVIQKDPENREEYIQREKEALVLLYGCKQHDRNCNEDCSNGFVKLYATFHDDQNHYYVLSYAKNGELLQHINNVGAFELKVAKHYAAELLLAIEKMHARGVIHRDLNPENILLDERMHLQIADFGLALIILKNVTTVPNPPNGEIAGSKLIQRKKSYIKKTVEYLSPELVTSTQTSFTADLWAFGCIIYTMISGLPPFRDSIEFHTLMKITKVDYRFPDTFPPEATDLVEKLLVLDASKRLGAKDESEEYKSIRNHPFFDGIDWDNVYNRDPPPIAANIIENQRAGN